ncbi:hypothetical protein TUM20985_34300 [Mycobacterium antarcticum]|uniref:hypothetical protein n=1 Tax=unclassified Mycolicibacterium TaxID=2636767 RepID=UPI0023A1BF6D|nr:MULTISPECIES: hypothetical protein [unclassified Mycolicibacterium]BDX32883.1 hypothetical protein TUM20985_34300 [Mycolicibacterium sp. TUM20985]GLP76061.1 hypothetical protein TUM20983_31710 [Mycolicibacterium sp. TUM20983]GLP83559.1 hypothetical protein TUM20984_49790 [Mycolicibacterium sp. TUM20984]
MTGLLLYGYVAGWIVTSVLVAVFAWRLRDETAPPPHPRLLALLAGAAWPVLIVAIAEAGAVAITAEVLHDDQQPLPVDA